MLSSMKRSPWYRWYRWRMRHGQDARRATSRVLGCVLALFTIDLLTKALLTTPSWGWHPTDPKSMLPLLLAIPFLFWRWTRWPFAVALAGALGNTVSSLSPRGAANPFVADGGSIPGRLITGMGGSTGTGSMAFNFADVCITVGAMGAIVALLAFALVTFRHTEFEGVVRRSRA